jgi:hypothetical protein
MKNQIMLAAILFTLGGCASQPSAEKANLQGNWFDVEGTTKGHVLRAKLNGDLRDKIGDAHYPYQVTVSESFTPVPPDGLPGKEDQAKLDKAKEALKALEQDKQGYLAIVITTGGMKQFIFYSADAVRAAQTVGEIQKANPEFEFQVAMEPDKNWSLYRALAANAK